jgi:hypothetical protein
MRLAVIVAMVAWIVSACATYVPPGEKADLQVFAPPVIREGFSIQPTNPFPASIAVVRVQAPEYRNYSLDRLGGTYGSGKYSVVLTREAGEDRQLERVGHLDQVAGLVSLNRMLLPERMEGDRELRTAASRLQADMVLLYTFDTSFFDVNRSKALTAISLGGARTKRISATTTCSALLLDTRTGYIYSAYEVTERADASASVWNSEDSADQMRRATEQEAFRKLAEEMIATWPRVLERHHRTQAHAMPRLGTHIAMTPVAMNPSTVA